MIRALVTGGGGFLGSAVVRRLLAGGWTVRVLGRRRYPELEALGVEGLVGDVAEEDAARRACAGCDVVFHAAGKVGLWGRPGDFRRTNVRGTRLVVCAAQDAGARAFVFTGSPSVVFGGGDVEGADESAPYPPRFDSEYSRTKAAAEEVALSAHGPGFPVVSLRPHLIWGPGDPHVVARVVARARAGRLARVGDANRLVDTTYIDNAAEAHALAATRLLEGAPVGGRAYFVSNGEPRPLWDVVDAILGCAGLPPVKRRIPPRLAWAAAAACESVYRALRRQEEPPLTRFLVSQLTTAHWFDITAARRDLGYRPLVSLDEGFARLRAWYST